MNRIVYLVRHGRTFSNQQKIYAGWSEEELTEEGAAQADVLGKKIAGWNIEAIYTSPIRRAVQTAEILNRYVRKELTVELCLAEMKMGPWEGLSEADIAQSYPDEFQLWHSRPSRLRLEGRETLAEVQDRVASAIRRILDFSSYTTTLVVTHVAIIRCLIMYYHKLELDMYKKIDVPNLSINKLVVEGRLPTALSSSVEKF